MAATKSKITKTEVSNVEPESVKSEQAAVEQPKYRVKKNLDPNMIVTVKNGFQGVLVYVSARTHERFVWEEFGDEQDMELQELKNARNASKKFFENNWFIIDDTEVLAYLGVENYYKYALNTETFDELFTASPEKIKETISHLSDGQKKSVIYRAKRMIADKTIDSIKVINALEESLDIELIER